MDVCGITHSHDTRARGLAGAGAAPQQTSTTPPPTLTVGVAHGSGSQPIAGPHQVQHHPLHNTATEQAPQDKNDPESLTPHSSREDGREHQGTLSAIGAAQLTPGQQDFVDRAEAKLHHGASRESRPTTSPGDAGAQHTSTTLRTSRPTPEQAEWTQYVPFSEGQAPEPDFPPSTEPGESPPQKGPWSEAEWAQRHPSRAQAESERRAKKISFGDHTEGETYRPFQPTPGRWAQEEVERLRERLAEQSVYSATRLNSPKPSAAARAP